MVAQTCDTGMLEKSRWTPSFRILAISLLLRKALEILREKGWVETKIFKINFPDGQSSHIFDKVSSYWYLLLWHSHYKAHRPHEFRPLSGISAPISKSTRSPTYMKACSPFLNAHAQNICNLIPSYTINMPFFYSILVPSQHF